jgi:integrase
MAPLTAAQAAMIRARLIAEQKIRDLALFNTALDTMLRASDLMPLRVRQVTGHRGWIVAEFPIRQRKTGRSHVVALSRGTRKSLAEWIMVSHKGAAVDSMVRPTGLTVIRPEPLARERETNHWRCLSAAVNSKNLRKGGGTSKLGLVRPTGLEPVTPRSVEPKKGSAKQ